MTTDIPDFQWQTEQFADIRILRYRVEGFESLPLQQKLMVWHLYQAAMAGRDIIYDQNYKHNLLLRKVLETLWLKSEEEKTSPEWEAFAVFLKQFWFSNGLHHHYSTDKLVPAFSEAFIREKMALIHPNDLPLKLDQSRRQLIDFVADQLFNPLVAPKRVEQKTGCDLVLSSACNFYEGITESEATAFYAAKNPDNPQQPPSWGLNSKLIKQNGQIKEHLYHSDGRYGRAIRKIVSQLDRASRFAENRLQQELIQKLIAYYESGDLKLFDEYSILWVEDTTSAIDFVNGFIEVYGDPLGHHGAWQSVVSMRDVEASTRLGKLSELAGWFEKHSPVAENHKRSEAAGISYKVIQVIVEAGDSAPSSPIGVNLPNADWIRAQYGSKSVSLGNIEDAYEYSSKNNGSLEEFYLPEQQDRIRKHANSASKLHTGLHEVIGHGSGKIMPGVATPKETLKSYSNTIEEARADLVALYFITDPVLIEHGLCETDETGKASYDSFMLNGLMRQLVRVEPGKNLEESHMRNRQLIAQWAYEKGKPKGVVEKISQNGKTFIRINDYAGLRQIFGELLKEVQRIKSEGDYRAAQQLVESYGVNVDPQLHQEMLDRWKLLNIAPFAGFIQPRLTAVKQDGRITDVLISYPDNFMQQMVYYSENYSFLPLEND